MDAGIESRVIIHKILKLIKIQSKNFDFAFSKAILSKKLNEQDKKFIYNACLTALRNSPKINNIIRKLVKKINFESDSYFLLLSSINQLLFMNLKEYAVVYSTVEMSKDKKINSSPSFINGCLRSFIRYSKKNIDEKPKFSDLPNWFIEKTKGLTEATKNSFIKNITNQPSLHIVIKNKEKMENYINFGKMTSDNSIAINDKYNFNDIPNFKDGEWWVQDFSSMLPISLIDISDIQKIADIGSAPGGKLFQLMSRGKYISPYEKSKKRIKILNKNLKRLKLNIDINNKNILDENINKKFDIITIDAPCSAVGTIRRHPEIFFKKKSPDLNSLIKTQYDLLKKSSNLLSKNGIIIYMTCSFLEIETTAQITKFLKNNKKFSLEKFTPKKNFLSKKLIDERGYIYYLPQTILGDVRVDGFFACKLIKNDD